MSDPKAKFEEMKAEYQAQFGVSWDDVSTFHATIGLAISHWAYMETHLVKICARLLGASDERTGVMLYSIMNFHSWLNIIDDLFLLTPSYSKQKAAWGKESTKLRAMADIRNRLAHHTALGKGSPTLKPTALDARSKSKKHSPLAIQEILDFDSTIVKMNDALLAIHQELPANLPAQHSVSAEAFPEIPSSPNLGPLGEGDSR